MLYVAEKLHKLLSFKVLWFCFGDENIEHSEMLSQTMCSLHLLRFESLTFDSADNDAKLSSQVVLPHEPNSLYDFTTQFCNIVQQLGYMTHPQTAL